MKTFVFSSKEELLNQAKEDDACQKGLLWANKQESLESILKEISLEYRIWCLKKGYMQFTEHCKWELLSGHEWVELLYLHPNLSSFCSYLDKLDGEDWESLLSKQPQFSEYCLCWEKLDGEDWETLLSKQPQLSSFCSYWEKLDGSNWRNLLIENPQFSEFCFWEKLNEFNLAYLLSKQPQLEKFKK